MVIHESFDTIAPITPKGWFNPVYGAVLYQYHATPDDNYCFSHKALTSLLEDRGFTVLEIGDNIVPNPPKCL